MSPNRTGAETALGAVLPSRRDEAWKWTDVRAAVPPSVQGLTQAGKLKFDVPDGVHICEGEGHKGDTVMGQIANDHAGTAWNIYVPAGTEPDKALTLSEISAGHTRIAIMVDKGATLEMIEHHAGTAGSFTNLDMQIHLAEGATLTRSFMHDDPEDTVRIVTTCVAMESGARINQFGLSFGGKLSRLETRIHGEGKAIGANINGAYLLRDKRHTDMTSHIDLATPDALIRQAVKGVVTDTARGVFQGKFHVERPAQKTDAEMRHDALMLSDTAQVRAKPELEIYADDVECAHGNTIGALDADALFYMQSRGIPLKAARALLTEAFVAGVFDDMTDDALKTAFLTQIQNWLEARE